MKTLSVIWHILAGLIYLAVVIGILSAATTRFETLMLAGLVQVYAALLYNFSVLGVQADLNNYGGFVRFKILANAQGITENADGTFEEQDKALSEAIKSYQTRVVIQRFANGIVSLYAMIRIVMAIF